MAEHHHHHPEGGGADGRGLNKLALMATLHCLTGCSIGEVLGMVIASAQGWGNLASVALSVVLAFVFGYSLTIWPLLRAKLPLRRAAAVALASDTASITTMEIVDNLILVVTPGAMSAGLGAPLFWITMAISLAVGGLAAFPVNRWLIQRGKGHALAHAHHAH